MSSEKLPIKFFAPREVDELKVEGAGSSEEPKWVLKDDELRQRSSDLLISFNQFSNVINERAKKKSAVPFVFVAKMCDDSTAKSRRKDISTLFQIKEKSNVIGLADSDELIVKIDSTEQMNEISNRLRDFQRNNYAISCLETFLEFEPMIQKQDNETTYKIKLIDFQDYETNIAMQRLFERTLVSHEILFKKTDYASQFPIYKIEADPQIMLDELQGEDAYEALFSIEPMPKYMATLDTIKDDKIIEVKTPINGQHYETLGILDNGIAPISHLSPWLPEKRWSVYPESDINPTHGTFVAGVALYGDTCEKQD